MPFLLATVTLSELRKKSKAAAPVIAWQDSAAGQKAQVSVMTVNEIRFGTRRAAARDPVFARRLERWYGEILAAPQLDAILPVSLAIAEQAADFRHAHGTSVHDSLIAATAKIHGLTLATRNLADFEPTGIDLLNPWNYRG
mgnify:CR=1 FL=1